MKDWTPIRDRFLRDGIPVRLGGLAPNLSRIQAFSADDAGRAAAASVVEESKWFIEWMAHETPIETAAQLVELQIQLALWQLRWSQIWHDPESRKQLADQSSAWSDRVLVLSGLLNF